MTISIPLESEFSEDSDFYLQLLENRKSAKFVRSKKRGKLLSGKGSKKCPKLENYRKKINFIDLNWLENRVFHFSELMTEFRVCIEGILVSILM